MTDEAPANCAECGVPSRSLAAKGRKYGPCPMSSANQIKPASPNPYGRVLDHQIGAKPIPAADCGEIHQSWDAWCGLLLCGCP